MNVMWMKIRDFSNYEVSNTGMVRNIKSGLVLKHKHAGAGYSQVSLGAKNYRYIHRLVAQHFISNPDNLPYVNHLDGNKSNNSISNLQWCTAKQNSRHAYEVGLLNNTACVNPVSGHKHHRSKPVVMSSDTNHIQITYENIRKASKETGIDYSTIHGAIHGKFKQAGGWNWNFYDRRN